MNWKLPTCSHPEHNPPTHKLFKDGEVHTCPQMWEKASNTYYHYILVDLPLLH